MPKYHQARVFTLLVIIVMAGYLLTYRGRIESGDTLRAMDALTSLSRFGDTLMDESTWFKPPLRIRADLEWPLSEFDVEERLQLRLALPLLKLAETLPDIGNIHAVWLFNIIVTSLSVGVIYLMLRSLEFGGEAALLVALSAAFSTNLWAYSQTFFREPLVGLFLMAALFLIQVARRYPPPIHALGVAAGLFCFGLAVLTKSSALFAAPAILVFALPVFSPRNSRAARKLSAIVLTLVIVLLAALMLAEPLASSLRGLLPESDPANDYLAYALRVYLLSPGGSLWGTSPLLLLSIAGAIMLLRQGQLRLIWTIVLLAAGYAVMHALTTGAHWFGGLSWPPRFLTPVIPVAALAAAPVAHKVVNGRNKWLWLIWILPLLYGMWIQFSAVSLGLEHYGESLPAESMALSEWAPGLTEPRYFRWVVLPGRWADLGIDFLWIRSGQAWWLISFGALGIPCAFVLLRIWRSPRSRPRHLAPALTLLMLPLLYLNLRAAYARDTATRSQQPALHEALATLVENQSGDVLLLPDNLYGEFILNHLDSNDIRPIVLPASPAQAASDKQPALLESSNPSDWFDVASFRALHHLAGGRDRVFLLAHTSPFMTWSFRPYERYLAQRYYPLGEIELSHPDDAARLLEYSTRHNAPNPMTLYLGEITTDLVYGEEIWLRGLVLPGGDRYAPGDTLELSLLWQALKAPSNDYTVAWFVVDSSSGAPVAQGRDSKPQAGFSPTTSWNAGAPVWDNRALRLPEVLAAREYLLWVLLYRYDHASGEIVRLPVTGSNVTENGSVGVLPLPIVVG